MKYLKLFTNPYSLALLLIIVLAYLCLMASSEFTANIIVIKAIGFFLVWVYTRLFKYWNGKGKIDVVKELFTGDAYGEPGELDRK